MKSSPAITASSGRVPRRPAAVQPHPELVAAVQPHPRSPLQRSQLCPARARRARCRVFVRDHDDGAAADGQPPDRPVPGRPPASFPPGAAAASPGARSSGRKLSRARRQGGREIQLHEHPRAQAKPLQCISARIWSVPSPRRSLAATRRPPHPSCVSGAQRRAGAGAAPAAVRGADRGLVRTKPSAAGLTSAALERTRGRAPEPRDGWWRITGCPRSGTVAVPAGGPLRPLLPGENLFPPSPAPEERTRRPPPAAGARPLVAPRRTRRHCRHVGLDERTGPRGCTRVLP